MTGNPYHDADGKFSSKDESMKSYENAIADADESADYEKADDLRKDYENMMIEADPQSEIAQTALQRDYGNKSLSKNSSQTRAEKKRERQIEKAEKHTQKIINNIQTKLNEYKSKGLSEEKFMDDMLDTSFGWRNNLDDRDLFVPEKIVKPIGDTREIPVSEMREGDIITVSIYPNSNGPTNYTSRIKRGAGGHFTLHNEHTRMNSDRDSYVLGDTIQKVQENSIILKVIRDEGAEEFLKEHKEREKKNKERRAKIKELEKQQQELEKELYETRGY